MICFWLVVVLITVTFLLPPFLCCAFSEAARGSCWLNCFLHLEYLCVSDEITFKRSSILSSADLNQINISVSWDMIESIFTLLHPLIALSFNCSSRGRARGEATEWKLPSWLNIFLWLSYTSVFTHRLVPGKVTLDLHVCSTACWAAYLVTRGFINKQK